MVVDGIWDFEYCARKRFINLCVVQHLTVGGGIMIVYSEIPCCRRTIIGVISGNLNGVRHLDEIMQEDHIPFDKDMSSHYNRTMLDHMLHVF